MQQFSLHSFVLPFLLVPCPSFCNTNFYTIFTLRSTSSFHHTLLQSLHLTPYLSHPSFLSFFLSIPTLSFSSPLSYPISFLLFRFLFPSKFFLPLLASPCFPPHLSSLPLTPLPTSAPPLCTSSASPSVSLQYMRPPFCLPTSAQD
jgi:hypothetical protein